MLPQEPSQIVTMFLECQYLPDTPCPPLTYGRLDGISPSTPQTTLKGSAKRKAAYETPAPSKVGRSNLRSSPTEGRTPAQTINGIV